MKRRSSVFTTITISVLIASTMGLTACLEESGDSFNIVSIPTVTVDCDGAWADDCFTAGGATAQVFWHKGSVDCASRFIELQGQDYGRFFEAFGYTTVLDIGAALQGDVTAWFNVGGSLTTLPNSSYTLCSFIDSSGNGRFDIGEPYGQKDGQSPGTGIIFLNSWNF